MKNNINSNDVLVTLMTLLALLIFGFLTLLAVSAFTDNGCSDYTINQIKSGDVPARCAK